MTLVLDKIVFGQGSFSVSADLHIEKGDLVAIIGPSGAGKSTFLNGLAGFMPATLGMVGWQGQDITKAAPATRPMSMIFQDNNLFPHMSAFDNTALGLNPSLRLSSDETMQVLNALGQVGLKGFESRKPGELSGGQQSRVVIARVLLMARPILLLDEPFAALGPGLRKEMLDLIIDLAKAHDLTVLMVTHDPDEAKRFPLTMYVDAGQVSPPAETAQLFANPPKALQAYLGI
jgi:thiamine transport system ATP-binding protein